MPFYGRDWYDDINVHEMTYAEQGMYLRLCWWCWAEGSIPDDGERIAHLLRVDVATFSPSWAIIRQCFSPAGDRLTHLKVEELRTEVNSFSKKQSENAKRRWGAKDAKVMPEVCQNDAVAVPRQCHGILPASIRHTSGIALAYAKPMPASASASTSAEENTVWREKAFEEFLLTYPRKGEDHDRLAQMHISMIPTPEAHEAMMISLRSWMGSEQWRNVKYISKASNWLKNRLWLDAPPVAKSNRDIVEGMK